MLYRVTCVNGTRVKILCRTLEKEDERILRVDQWALVQFESDVLLVEGEVKRAGEVSPGDSGVGKAPGEERPAADPHSDG